jgi:hypothetical protein
LKPIDRLNLMMRLYPATGNLVSDLYKSRGLDIPDWPQWCLLPLTRWCSIFAAQLDVPFLQNKHQAQIASMAAIVTWRYGQGVYRFDPDVYAALVDCPPSGPIPSDVLLRLPEWCVYIETEGLKWREQTLFGFWAHLDADDETGEPRLRLLLNLDGAVHAVPLTLGALTIEQSITLCVDHSRSREGLDSIQAGALAKSLTKGIEPLISLLLYICSDEPEIDDERQPGSSPYRVVPRKTKKGFQLFPSDRVRVWDIGKETGASIRQSRAQQSSSGSKTMHFRRAHWHGFWTGPRDSQRKFHYKWIPTVVVGGR